MAGPEHAEITVGPLPESALEAHAALIAQQLDPIRQVMGEGATSTLTLILPAAGPEHDRWRRALAGDLAREYAPKRVNLAAGPAGEELDTLLAYLRDAPGVTGHYLQTHE